MRYITIFLSIKMSRPLRSVVKENDINPYRLAHSDVIVIGAMSALDAWLNLGSGIIGGFIWVVASNLYDSYVILLRSKIDKLKNEIENLEWSARLHKMRTPED